MLLEKILKVQSKLLGYSALIALIVGSCLASTSYASSSAGNATIVTSTDYAGYRSQISSLSGLSQFTASWVEPSLSCSTGTTNAVATISAGFFDSPNFVVAGARLQCANPSGTTTTLQQLQFSFSNWCEGSTCGIVQYVNSFTPKPLDHISVVISVTKTAVTITFKDTTGGQSFTQSCATPPSGVSLSGACSSLTGGTSGAFFTWTINKDIISGVAQPVPNFVNIGYGKDKTSVASSCGVVMSGKSKTIASSGTVTRYEWVSQSNSKVILVEPSALSSDGTSFTNVFHNAGP